MYSEPPFRKNRVNLVSCLKISTSFRVPQLQHRARGNSYRTFSAMDRGRFGPK